MVETTVSKGNKTGATEWSPLMFFFSKFSIMRQFPYSFKINSNQVFFFFNLHQKSLIQVIMSLTKKYKHHLLDGI